MALSMGETALGFHIPVYEEDGKVVALPRDLDALLLADLLVSKVSTIFTPLVDTCFGKVCMPSEGNVLARLIRPRPSILCQWDDFLRFFVVARAPKLTRGRNEAHAACLPGLLRQSLPYSSFWEPS